MNTPDVLRLSGVERISDERRRQVEEERYSSDRDDEYTEHELAFAACHYADPGTLRWVDWPWTPESNKGTTADARDRLLSHTETADDLQRRVRELTKAGALIAAEIDRLLRLMNKGE